MAAEALNQYMFLFLFALRYPQWPHDQEQEDLLTCQSSEDLFFISVSDENETDNIFLSSLWSMVLKQKRK